MGTTFGTGRPTCGLFNSKAPHRPQLEVLAAAPPGQARSEGDGLWQFQRERQRATHQQTQPRPDKQIGERDDNSSRVDSGRAASSSQTRNKTNRQAPQQHASWLLPGGKDTSNGRGSGRRQSASQIDRSRDRPAPQSQQGSPDREGFFKDDAFWDDLPATNGSQNRTAVLDGRRSQPNPAQRQSQAAERPMPFEETNGRGQVFDPWQADASPPSNRWGDVPSIAHQSRPQQSDRSPLPRKGQSPALRKQGRQNKPSGPSFGDDGNAGSKEPWQQMKLGKKDSREMDRKARVQVAIACNKITLTAFDQFTAELQAADRMADRQEVLQAFINKLEDTIRGNEGCLDTVNISGALQKLATACCAVPPVGEILLSARRLFQALIALALKLQSTFKLDAINVTIGALARLSNHSTAKNVLPIAGSEEALDIQVLLEGFAIRACNRLLEPPPPEAHQLALLVWGYSRLSLDPLGGKLFNLALKESAPLIGRFDSQNISNFLLAAATLEKQLPEEFLDQMARQAILKMPQASPQGIANLLWACAKLTKTPPVGGELFRTAMSRASEVMGEFSIQNVANLFWAAVQFEHRLTPRMLARFAAAAVNKMEGASTVSIAGLLMSYTKMEDLSGEEPLFLACIQEVDKKLEQCNSQTMSNMIWSLGSVNADLPSLLLQRLDQAWAERALTLLEELWGQPQGSGWSQNVGNILWGYSQLRLDPLQGRFFQKVLSRLSPSDLEVMEVSHVSSILMAAGNLQRKSFSPEFLKQAVKHILAKGKTQEICNTMWSLTALGLLQRPAMKSLAQQLEAATSGQPIDSFSARQALTANAILNDGKAGSHPVLPQNMLDMYQATLLENAQPSTISRFHEEVSEALEAMGVPHAIEFTSPDTLVSIDIVARCGDGKPVAIEVDGPSHFTRLPPHRPLGHTTVRNQLVAALGFRGVGIPFYDWYNIGSKADRVAYMTARMAKWGITPY